MMTNKNKVNKTKVKVKNLLIDLFFSQKLKL